MTTRKQCLLDISGQPHIGTCSSCNTMQKTCVNLNKTMERGVQQEIPPLAKELLAIYRKAWFPLKTLAPDQLIMLQWKSTHAKDLGSINWPWWEEIGCNVDGMDKKDGSREYWGRENEYNQNTLKKS